MLDQMHWRESVPVELWEAPRIQAWKIDDAYGQMAIKEVEVVRDEKGLLAWEWPMGRRHVLFTGPIATIYFDYAAALTYAAETCELRAQSNARQAREYRAALSNIAPPKEPEAEERCEWCGKPYPKSEMNSIEWGGDPNRIKRICDRCCDEGS